MGRSIYSPSVSLIFLLSFIILSIGDLFGANLRVNAVNNPLIKAACEFSNTRDFCYNVFENSGLAEYAVTKANVEDLAIELAKDNYTNIARKVLTVTSNETNPEYRQVYRKCLHQYLILKSDFNNLDSTWVDGGDLEQASLLAIRHLFTCMNYFRDSPNIPNPISEDNTNLYYFFELIRSIYLTDM